LDFVPSLRIFIKFEKLGVKIENWGPEAKIGDEIRFSFCVFTFCHTFETFFFGQWIFFVFWDLKIYKKLGLTKLGGQFWNIFFWADLTWETVSGFQFKKFCGGNIKGTSFGLFFGQLWFGHI
jgi:hypothetical protein